MEPGAKRKTTKRETSPVAERARWGEDSGFCVLLWVVRRYVGCRSQQDIGRESPEGHKTRSMTSKLAALHFGLISLVDSYLKIYHFS